MPSVHRRTSLDSLWAELARIARLSWLERRLAAMGYRHVAGIDEAGRGSFAGPVVAAAVILPANAPVLEVDDSKKLDAEERGRAAERIRGLGAVIGIGVVSPEEIDAEDILTATKRAMMAALRALPVRPDALLVDAVDLPESTCPVLPLIHGDARSISIAAASVIAKTTRDALMGDWDRIYPWYGFRSNVGYGTEDHRVALRRHGPSPIHRLTFRGVVPAKSSGSMFASA